MNNIEAEKISNNRVCKDCQGNLIISQSRFVKGYFLKCANRQCNKIITSIEETIKIPYSPREQKAVDEYYERINKHDSQKY